MPMNSNPFSRRSFVFGAVATTALAIQPKLIWAGDIRRLEHRTLRLVSLHTGERLNVTYFERGNYLPDALEAINYQLRDHRTGDVQAIAVKLLDALALLASKQAPHSLFEVISGYRSPQTNQRLAASSSGVAKRSYHMRGMAIDVRISGVSTSVLRDAAVAMHQGGVGYYPRDRFVHIDVGRPRRWGPRA